MKLMNERRLRELISQGQLILEGPTDRVKGCAVDLTVGQIFVPGTSIKDLGSIDLPRVQLMLEQGQTAVIRTLEKLELTTHQSCAVFPASSVSLKGLLMTNPGHVDPGYRGHLHVTVINFGSQPYPLLEGGRLLRALFLEDENDQFADKAYPDRPSPISTELLMGLSRDFLDVEKRAQRAADKVDTKIKLWSILASVATAAITVLGYWSLAGTKLDERMGKVEALVPIQRQLDDLERDRLRVLEERLAKLEEHRRGK